MKIEVSIIIVSFNTGKLTTALIRSIGRYVKDISYEMVVIDNASSDSSVEALAALKKEGYQLNLFLNQKNEGFAKAINLGMSKAKGKYLFLLNPDTIIHDNIVQKLLDFAKSTPRAGVISPRLLNADGSVQPSVFRFPTIKNAILEYWFGKKGLFAIYAPSLASSKPIAVDVVAGTAFFITPEALEKVGRLDERYFMFYEDLDYCRRVKRLGLGIYYLPGAQITHFHGQSGKNLVGEKEQWKRLVPSSIIYHGIVRHYLLTLIIWSSQKLKKLFGR